MVLTRQKLFKLASSKSVGIKLTALLTGGPTAVSIEKTSVSNFKFGKISYYRSNDIKNRRLYRTVLYIMVRCHLILIEDNDENAFLIHQMNPKVIHLR